MFENLFAHRGLSLDRLRTFLEVSDAGGIAKAVKDDPVRQSQYSRQIKELEEYFGVELIRRKGKGIEVTSIGRDLAKIIREQFGSLSDFQSRCVSAPLTVSIGAGDSILQWLVLPSLGELQKTAPKIRFRLSNQRSADIVKELDDLTLDFGIVRDSTISKLHGKQTLGSFGYGLYVPKKLLGRKRKVDYKWVFDELPLATQGSIGVFRREMEGHARRHETNVNIKLNCESFTQAYHALISGEYAAILPTIARREIDKSQIVEIDTPFLTKQSRKIMLCWNPRMLRIRPINQLILKELGDRLKV